MTSEKNRVDSEPTEILTRKQPVITKLLILFSSERLLLQHSVLSHKIDLYFIDYKIAIELMMISV